MPAAGPVPREPPPRRFEVAPHRARGEHGEREQERRRLAADEEQPPPGDGGVVLHGAKLLDRRLDAEAPRGGGESGARALARPDEAVDLPQARLPGGERPDPRVAAVGVRDGRCPRQGPDSLRHDERGGRRPVIARMPAAGPVRPHDRRGRCRSAPENPRRAGSSGACPCRPGRAGAPAHPAARPLLAAAGPRSAPGCTRVGAGRSTTGRTVRGPRRRRARRSARRRCSRGRARWASDRGGRCRRASSGPRRRGPDTPPQRRPGRRTTPPAPSARRRGPAPRPARCCGPARSSCRRGRRRGLPSRPRSRSLREARPRNAC